MEPNLFAYLDSRLMTPLNNFMDSGVNGLTTYLVSPLAVGITIYVILNGIAFTRGLTNESVMEFVIKSMKLAIIFFLATKASEINFYVKNVFFDYLPNEIGAAITGVNGGNSGNTQVSATALDALFKKGIKAGNDMWKLSPNDLSVFLYAFMFAILLIATFLMCAFGYIVLFYAKAALAILIAISPVFIACALFQSTRRFTEAWIGQTVNFVILQILVISIGALLVEAASSFSISVSSIDTAFLGAAQMILIAICAWYIFMQLPSIASGLAAGGANLAFGGHVYPSTPLQAAYNAMRGSKSAPPPTTAPNASSRSDHTQQNTSPAGGISPSQTTAPAPERPPAPVTRPSS